MLVMVEGTLKTDFQAPTVDNGVAVPVRFICGLRFGASNAELPAR